MGQSPPFMRALAPIIRISPVIFHFFNAAKQFGIITSINLKEYFKSFNTDFIIDDDVSVVGEYGMYNIVLVTYNSEGKTLWARSVSESSGESNFNSVCADSTGNIIVSGYMVNNADFGNGVNLSSTNTRHTVIVKYAPDGTALWAHTTSANTFESYYQSVRTDSNDNVYAVPFFDLTDSITNASILPQMNINQ